ncbi:MAG: prepilin-type N-terminal cleavage/methylation domain-containing protein [Microthrixaceae bacterium]|nr:prepilin-type N-terminal cleavage/methylation domain-containing protein [Microthrixaceae bacterium]
MIKTRMEQRGQGGFTLIELLVVIAILAELAGGRIIGIGAMRTNAQKTACKSDKDTVETAAGSLPDR